MAAAENVGATADGVFDEVEHALDMLRTDHRTDVSGGVVSGADAQLFGFWHAARGEFIAHGLLDKEPLDGEADLAAICVTAPDGGAGCDVEVGIGKDEHGVFAAEFEHGWDETLGACFTDAAAGCYATCEKDFFWIAFDQRLAHFPAPLHDGD